MRLFLLTVIVAGSLSHAASMTSASCTLGTTTQTVTDPFSSSCFISVQGFSEGVGADARVSESLGEGQSTIFVNVDAGAAGIPLDSIWSASASAEDSLTLLSEKVPPFASHGSIQLDISGNAFITDGVHEYDPSDLPLIQCHFGGCDYGGTLPFDIGTEFQVSVSAGVEGGFCFSTCASADSSITFSLFEADGMNAGFEVAPPIPEPSTLGLVLFGIAAAGLIARRSQVSHNQ